jgi:hypothetical protein
MTLSTADVEYMIQHTLDGELPPEIATSAIMERAGRWLYSIHPWTWLTRSSTLGVAAAANFTSIESLPATAILGLGYTTQGTTFTLRATSFADIQHRRLAFTNAAPVAWYAMASRDDGTTGVPYRTLEFEQAFSATNTTALTALYRRGWPAQYQFIPVLPEWEGFYLQAVRAYARGYQEEDIVPLNIRMDSLMTAEFRSLIRMDGMSQSNRGAARGGGVESQMAVPNSGIPYRKDRLY